MKMYKAQNHVSDVQVLSHLNVLPSPRLRIVTCGLLCSWIFDMAFVSFLII
jgi:hypothetical protein